MNYTDVKELSNMINNIIIIFEKYYNNDIKYSLATFRNIQNFLIESNFLIYDEEKKEIKKNYRRYVYATCWNVRILHME